MQSVVERFPLMIREVHYFAIIRDSTVYETVCMYSMFVVVQYICMLVEKLVGLNT